MSPSTTQPTSSQLFSPSPTTSPLKPGSPSSLIDTLACGTAAGFICEVILYPIEHPTLFLTRPLHNSSTTTPSPRNLVSFKPSIPTHEILKDLARVSISRAPATGLLMASYEFARSLITSHIPTTSTFSISFTSGILATATESLLLSPFLALQTHMSANPSTSYLSAAKTLGLRGLYNPRTISSIIATTAPFVSLYYAFSDVIFPHVRQFPDWSQSAIAGTLGGTLAIIASAPIEALRLYFVESEAVSLKSRLVHQPPRFAFRRVFFGVLKKGVSGGVRGVGRWGVGMVTRRGVAGWLRGLMRK